ncbi:MAG: M23 family metallopeptidase [Leeuwenhoekiella sp.]
MLKNRHYILSLFFLCFGCLCFSQETKDAPASEAKEVSFSLKILKDSLFLIAQNHLLSPMEVITYSREDNKELNAYLLPVNQSIKLMAFDSVTDRRELAAQLTDSIRFAYYFGHKSKIDIDSTFAYRLPFRPRKKYEVSQSFGGKFSHNDHISFYAIDFKMKEGEPVHAARSGLVVKVVDSFSESGGRELINASNKILILHDDGTHGTYVHLKHKGSLVKVGDIVNKGDHIGYSGNTGFTRGPHLHFVVRKERDTAIPIYFEGYGEATLKKGKQYKVK